MPTANRVIDTAITATCAGRCSRNGMAKAIVTTNSAVPTTSARMIDRPGVMASFWQRAQRPTQPLGEHVVGELRLGAGPCRGADLAPPLRVVEQTGDGLDRLADAFRMTDHHAGDVVHDRVLGAT